MAFSRSTALACFSSRSIEAASWTLTTISDVPADIGFVFLRFCAWFWDPLRVYHGAWCAISLYGLL